MSLILPPGPLAVVEVVVSVLVAVQFVHCRIRRPGGRSCINVYDYASSVDPCFTSAPGRTFFTTRSGKLNVRPDGYPWSCQEPFENMYGSMGARSSRAIENAMSASKIGNSPLKFPNRVFGVIIFGLWYISGNRSLGHR